MSRSFRWTALPSLTPRTIPGVGFLRWPNGTRRDSRLLISSRMEFGKCGISLGTVGRPRGNTNTRPRQTRHLSTANSKARAGWFSNNSDWAADRRVPLETGSTFFRIPVESFCNAEKFHSDRRKLRILGIVESGEGVGDGGGGESDTGETEPETAGEVDWHTIGTNGRSSTQAGQRIKRDMRRKPR